MNFIYFLNAFYGFKEYLYRPVGKHPYHPLKRIGDALMQLHFSVFKNLVSYVLFALLFLSCKSGVPSRGLQGCL